METRIAEWAHDYTIYLVIYEDGYYYYACLSTGEEREFKTFFSALKWCQNVAIHNS